MSIKAIGDGGMSMEYKSAEDDPHSELNSEFNKGYRTGWDAANGLRVPKLEPGTRVDVATLIYDQDGVGWWINPLHKECMKA